MKFFSYLLMGLLPLIWQGCQSSSESIRIGLIADSHKDIVYDADQRLQQFVDSMNDTKPDFIIQLGDFCRPYDYNMSYLKIWHSFNGEGFHVLGNHDMDGGFSRDSTVKFWDAPGKYYSFDRNGFHFVVLDGNDLNPSPERNPGYARYIGIAQQDWLVNDLESNQYPVVIFSHQNLQTGIENSDEILQLFLYSNMDKKSGQIIACINGHNHANHFTTYQGIHFIQINSMAYEWLGDDYVHYSYSDSIHSANPWVEYTAPYAEPLWALIEFNTKGEIRIDGRETKWVGPSPADLGHPGKGGGLQFSTKISDTLLLF